MDGIGTYRWPDGSTYDGCISDGLRHGNMGVFKCSAGQLYEGGWVKGKRLVCVFMAFCCCLFV